MKAALKMYTSHWFEKQQNFKTRVNRPFFLLFHQQIQAAQCQLRIAHAEELHRSEIECFCRLFCHRALLTCVLISPTLRLPVSSCGLLRESDQSSVQALQVGPLELTPKNRRWRRCILCQQLVQYIGAPFNYMAVSRIEFTCHKVAHLISTCHSHQGSCLNSMVLKISSVASSYCQLCQLVC